MLKNGTIFLLILLLNSSLFNKWAIVGYYEANHEYIAKVLCENRKHPELHCDGKCFLAKKLKKAEEQEQKQTSEKLEKIQKMTLFCVPLFSSEKTLLTFTSLTKRIVFPPHFFFAQEENFGVFHPPQV